MSLESIKAYASIRDGINAKEGKVLDALDGCGLTLREVAQKTSMPIQTTSARLSELHDKGYVHQKEGGKYHITPLEMIREVRNMRDDERFKKWLKLGKKNNWLSKYEAQKISEFYDGESSTQKETTQNAIFISR